MGQIRIIGGQWRGRKLKVLDLPDCRPTPNRVRETVFNWLAPIISGARCLDAFAGSGGFGFESLSRGAAFAVLVDQSREVITLLKEELNLFKATHVDVYRAIVPQQLKKPEKPFDIVFLDPPYQSDLLLTCCFYLEEHSFLAKEAYIYLEAKTSLCENDLPSNWTLLKSKRAGQVSYHLAIRKEKE